MYNYLSELLFVQLYIHRVASNFWDTFPGFFKVFKVTFELFSRS